MKSLVILHMTSSITYKISIGVKFGPVPLHLEDNNSSGFDFKSKDCWSIYNVGSLLKIKNISWCIYVKMNTFNKIFSTQLKTTCPSNQEPWTHVIKVNPNSILTVWGDSF